MQLVAYSPQKVRLQRTQRLEQYILVCFMTLVVQTINKLITKPLIRKSMLLSVYESIFLFLFMGKADNGAGFFSLIFS